MWPNWYTQNTRTDDKRRCFILKLHEIFTKIYNKKWHKDLNTSWKPLFQGAREKIAREIPRNQRKEMIKNKKSVQWLSNDQWRKPTAIKLMLWKD